MFKKFNRKPLIIEVFPDRYEAYGDTSSLWTTFLYRTLQKTGGINRNVPVGWYHFNVKLRGLKIVASLTPAKK